MLFHALTFFAELLAPFNTEADEDQCFFNELVLDDAIISSSTSLAAEEVGVDFGRLSLSAATI